MPAAPRTSRRGHGALLLAGAGLALTTCLSPAFVGSAPAPRTSATPARHAFSEDEGSSMSSAGRRSLLAAGLFGSLAAPTVAQAALSLPLPGVVPWEGPLVRSPSQAQVIDATKAGSDQVKAAWKFLRQLRDERAAAAAALKKDPQADVSALKNTIAPMRESTNNLIFFYDESTQQGIERLQRLMVQEQQQFDAEVDLPLNKKGEPQPRGAARVERLIQNLELYVIYANNLLEFEQKA